MKAAEGARRLEWWRGGSGEDLGGVVFGLDLFGGDDAGYFALGVDDEGCAEGAHIFAAIH